MRLTLVGLPLGNIEDISLRAISSLKTAKLVICEDTRVFRRLWLKLADLGFWKGEFNGKLEVLNEYNEKRRTGELAQIILAQGEALLVSDAGMPLISDPGYRLVKQVLEMDGEVISIPGPSALTTALSLSGLSSDRVLFLGFLPKRQSKRNKCWQAVRALGKLGLTAAIYESSKRILKTMREIEKEFGEKTKVVIARELTKTHEEVLRGTVEAIIKKVENKAIRGELVFLWRVAEF